MVSHERLYNRGRRLLKMSQSAGGQFIAPENRSSIMGASAGGRISPGNLQGGANQGWSHYEKYLNPSYWGEAINQAAPQFYENVKKPIHNMLRWSFGGEGRQPWSSQPRTLASRDTQYDQRADAWTSAMMDNYRGGSLNSYGKYRKPERRQSIKSHYPEPPPGKAPYGPQVNPNDSEMMSFIAKKEGQQWHSEAPVQEEKKMVASQ